MAGQPSISKEVVKNIVKEINQDIGIPVLNQKRPRGFYVTKTLLGQPQIKLCFNKGHSPFNKPLKVLGTPCNSNLRPYILSDSHHTLRAAIDAIEELGGNADSFTVPVTVDQTLASQYPTRAVFLEEAEKKNLIYAKGDTGESFPVMDIRDVPDGDMRGFIEATAATCSESRSYTAPKNHKPLWLRVGGETDFRDKNYVEFYIAEALRRGGVHYKSGDAITETSLNHARAILGSEANRTIIAKNGIRLIGVGKESGKELILGTSHTPQEYCATLKNTNALRKN
jgi:hypothetical protein